MSTESGFYKHGNELSSGFRPQGWLQPIRGRRESCHRLRTKRVDTKLVICTNKGMNFNLGVIFKIRKKPVKSTFNVSKVTTTDAGNKQTHSPLKVQVANIQFISIYYRKFTT